MGIFKVEKHYNYQVVDNLNDVMRAALCLAGSLGRHYAVKVCIHDESDEDEYNTVWIKIAASRLSPPGSVEGTFIMKDFDDRCVLYIDPVDETLTLMETEAFSKEYDVDLPF